MGDYEEITQEDQFHIKIKLSDGASKDTLVKNSDCIYKIKQQEFPSELKAEKQVRFIFQGKFMPDESLVSSHKLQEGSYIHAIISERKRQELIIERTHEDSDSFEIPIDIQIEARVEGHHIEEGTTSDLIWGIIFGYLLHILMLLCILTGRLNRKQRIGVLIGVTLSFWTLLNSKEIK
ncbi:unnamed protein product [Blepharisma stoltei]|uniref:Ubiquitin-like domain-containing protein n=1 Tax=Blepharisma stoltei TaxID=1481888 RepID=A0AAU9ISD0_9CILI|nr:unnamed protein product [Blepharisma stoltei]